MPNWCSNTLNISHEDPAMIARAKTAYAEGRFLQEFIPCPQDLTDTVSGSMAEDQRAAHEAQQAANLEKYGYANWYDFQVAQWGTKWDIGGGDAHMVEQDANGVVFNFDSAWAPPIAAYERLMEQGFKILAYYYEPGMAFCGKWDNGSDDYYEYADMTADEIEAMLPDDLDETFNISQSVSEWEQEQETENE
jgi:hypothetical protein